MNFNQDILALAGQVANETATVKRNDLSSANVKVENRFSVLFTPKATEFKPYAVEGNEGVQLTTKFVDEFGNAKVATMNIGTKVNGVDIATGTDAVAFIRANIGKTFHAQTSLGKKESNKGILYIAPNTKLETVDLVQNANSQLQGLGF